MCLLSEYICEQRNTNKVQYRLRLASYHSMPRSYPLSPNDVKKIKNCNRISDRNTWLRSTYTKIEVKNEGACC